MKQPVQLYGAGSDGTVLPAMASFKGSANDLFSPAAGSSFSTGDAAVTMAAMFAGGTQPGTPSQRAAALQSKDNPYNSSRTLTHEPKIGGGFFGFFKPKFQRSEGINKTVKVRPVFFATDTSLGAKIAWSGLTASVPDSLSVGYNRKEIGLLPISMTVEDVDINNDGRTDGNEYRMKQASLLATLDANLKTSGINASSARSVQFFAVGDSASLLAQQEYVRRAMFESMGGAAGKAIIEADLATGFDEMGVGPVVHALADIYRTLSKGPLASDEEAKLQVKALDDLAKQYPRLYNYDAYEFNSPDLVKSTSKISGGVVSGSNSFNRIINYEAALRSSISDIKTALSDSRYTFNDSPVAISKVFLEGVLADQENLHAIIIARLQSDPVVNDAVQYYLSLFIK